MAKGSFYGAVPVHGTDVCVKVHPAHQHTYENVTHEDDD